MKIRYAHTNVVAQDWEKLAGFYVRSLGCVPKPPERDLHGEWLDKAASLRSARIRGIHLSLPGYGEHGPTLEVFQYSEEEDRESRPINRPGFGHIAFAVEDVEEALETVVRNGGSAVGEIVEATIPGVGAIRFAYVRDPEGNIIELQKWG